MSDTSPAINAVGHKPNVKSVLLMLRVGGISTTRANNDVLTPTAGARLVITSAQFMSPASSGYASELYFGTGATILTDKTKAVAGSGRMVGEAFVPSAPLVFPAPVQSQVADEVLSCRTSVDIAAVDLAWWIVQYYEINASGVPL